MRKKLKQNSSFGKPKRIPKMVAEFFAKPQRYRNAHDKTVAVLAKMRKERASLRKAAEEIGIDPRTVVRYGGAAFTKAKNGRISAKRNDSLLRILVTPSPSGLQEVAVRGSRKATIIAKHANALRSFAQTGKSTALRQFQGKSIIDASGKKIPLLTDISEIERLANAGVLSFENVYARSA